MAIAKYRAMPVFSQADIDRFWSKVSIATSDECWPWKAGRDRDGYGMFWGAGFGWQAHRIALHLKNPIARLDICSLHECDNPPCCNPGHLFQGTNSDNQVDKKTKGRSLSGDRNPARLHPERLPRGDKSYRRLHPERYAKGDDHFCHKHPECMPRGEENGQAKLTAESVLEIRRLVQANVKKSVIAERFNVSPGCVYFIASRQTWKHI